MVCHLNVLITYSETTWGAMQLWCSICTGFLSFCKEVRVQGFTLVDEASIYTASGYTSVKYQVICDYSCRKERSSSLLATHTQILASCRDYLSLMGGGGYLAAPHRSRLELCSICRGSLTGLRKTVGVFVWFLLTFPVLGLHSREAVSEPEARLLGERYHWNYYWRLEVL